MHFGNKFRKKRLRRRNASAVIHEEYEIDPITKRYSGIAFSSVVLSEAFYLLSTVYLLDSAITFRVFLDMGPYALIGLIILLAVQVSLPYLKPFSTDIL